VISHRGSGRAAIGRRECLESRRFLVLAMPTDDVLAIVGRADELYRGRMQAGLVRESVMVLSGAFGGRDRYEVQWRLSRAMFFLGQEAKAGKDRAQLHRSGVEAGQRAIELSAGRVEGHFWAGVNLALLAESKRGLQGARALLWSRSELRLATELSPGYHDAGPLRSLGRLEHKSPRLLGGSRKLSRSLFDRALEIAPDNSVTLLYAAELAIDTQELDRAKRLMERIVELPIDREWEYENRRDKEIARRLLDSLG